MSGGVYKCHFVNSCRSHLGTHRCRNSFCNDARSIVLVVEGAGGGRLLQKILSISSKRKRGKNGNSGKGELHINLPFNV